MGLCGTFGTDVRTFKSLKCTLPTGHCGNHSDELCGVSWKDGDSPADRRTQCPATYSKPAVPWNELFKTCRCMFSTGHSGAHFDPFYEFAWLTENAPEVKDPRYVGDPPMRRYEQEHPMAMKLVLIACANCKFWAGEKDDTVRKALHHCRRHAPREHDTDGGIWPKTKAQEWCGEFKRRDDDMG